MSSVIIMVVYVSVSLPWSIRLRSARRVTLPNGMVWRFFEANAYLSYGAEDLAKAGVPDVKAWSTTIARYLPGIGIGLSKI